MNVKKKKRFVQRVFSVWVLLDGEKVNGFPVLMVSSVHRLEVSVQGLNEKRGELAAFVVILFYTTYINEIALLQAVFVRLRELPTTEAGMDKALISGEIKNMIFHDTLLSMHLLSCIS
ncbi:hypothetical protein VKA52_10260 [Halobacillus sp. HZG1]|nr:hypothetical protein [Halobacillus sp. HZG1]MEC3884107.1 hypothetical protein [Halobacillus sp. HZG1]